MIGQYVTVHGDVISHLNISQAQVEDGGLYGCKATNRYSVILQTMMYVGLNFYQAYLKILTTKERGFL